MDLFYFDGLALLMGGLILLVAGVIASFSIRYMDGDRHYKRYFLTLGGVTLAALVLVFSNNVALFALAWAVMGAALSRLIGHSKGWAQARQAGRLALVHFMGGAAALFAALALLGTQTGQWSISGILANLSTLDPGTLYSAGGLILLAAMVQSALFPFHKWLLASMTAPTPVSAFMHAGLVNAGGFLIVRFSSLFAAMPDMLLAVFAAGALTALVASYWMLTQPDIKRALGCSTSAQMGFMVLQCGLGFYTAAIAHLILHGFFKAYHFLAAGSAIENPLLPKSDTPGTGASIWARSCLMLVGGVTAALVFASLTNKTLINADSGIVLMAFAGLAGVQAATGLAGLAHINIALRTVWTVAIIGLAAALYAGLFGLIASAVPVDVPQDLSLIHLAGLGLFAAGWITMALGAHRSSTGIAARAYMTSLNAAQPPIQTIMNHRRTYNAG